MRAGLADQARRRIQIGCPGPGPMRIHGVKMRQKGSSGRLQIETEKKQKSVCCKSNKTKVVNARLQIKHII